MIGKRPENGGAVGGEAVDQDVGGPGKEDEGSCACGGNFIPCPETGEGFCQKEAGEDHDQQGVAGAAVKGEALGGVEERIENDIEVGDGSEQGTPEKGAVSDFFPEYGLADGGTESCLGE